MTLRTLIIDDEAPARDELAWLLAQLDEPVEVVGQAASAPEALAQIEGAPDPIDLIFLDVDMGGVDGVRLAELLRERGDQAPLIVFVTAYEEYAVDAFDVEAVDYLLKPVRTERLQRALARARARIGDDDEAASGPPDPEGGEASEEPERSLERISVEDHGVYRVIPASSILFFEAEDGIVVVQTLEGRFITDFSLKFLEQNLDPERFFRSHRSYIVRLDAIDSIAPWGAGTYRLILDRDEDLGVPLARSRASDLKSLIPWSATVFED